MAKDTQVFPNFEKEFIGNNTMRATGKIKKEASPFEYRSIVRRTTKQQDFKDNSSGLTTRDFNPIHSFKKGGLVHKTGIYRLHKGEMVVPKHIVDAKTKNWMLSDTGAMKV